jgi:antitoxin ParD1/3/4
MSLASLNISLPQPLKDYVEAQVKEGGYSTPSEYVRELVRRDRKQRAEERLEALLLEGLNSGEPIEITPEYWENKRQQLIERHSNKTSTRGRLALGVLQGTADTGMSTDEILALTRGKTNPATRRK